MTLEPAGTGLHCDPDCEICSEITSGVADSNSGLENRVLADFPHFVAMTSLGSLKPGYVLLWTREHVVSMATLSAAKLAELVEAIAELRRRALPDFGDMLVFEHGMGDDEIGAGCVSHAHLHLVPSDADLDAAVAASVTGWRAQPVGELPDLAGREYLFFMGVGDVREGRSTQVAHVPSQHVRRVVAKHIGREDEWDWAVYLFIANGIATYNSFASHP